VVTSTMSSRGPAPSEPDEVRNCDQHATHHDDENVAGNEVGKNHEGKTHDQRYNGLLFPAVYEEAEADGPEQQPPQKRSGIQCPLTCSALAGTAGFGQTPCALAVTV
jgi:hypothetical protein